MVTVLGTVLEAAAYCKEEEGIPVGEIFFPVGEMNFIRNSRRRNAGADLPGSDCAQRSSDALYELSACTHV